VFFERHISVTFRQVWIATELAGPSPAVGVFEDQIRSQRTRPSAGISTSTRTRPFSRFVCAFAQALRCFAGRIATAMRDPNPGKKPASSAHRLPGSSSRRPDPYHGHPGSDRSAHSSANWPTGPALKRRTLIDPNHPISAPHGHPCPPGHLISESESTERTHPGHKLRSSAIKVHADTHSLPQ